MSNIYFIFLANGLLTRSFFFADLAHHRLILRLTNKIKPMQILLLFPTGKMLKKTKMEKRLQKMVKVKASKKKGPKKKLKKKRYRKKSCLNKNVFNCKDCCLRKRIYSRCKYSWMLHHCFPEWNRRVVIEVLFRL